MQKDSRRGSVIRESPPSRPNVSLKVTNFSDVHSRTIYDDKHYVKRWYDTVSRDRLTKEKYGRTKRHADVTGVNITLQPVSRSTYVGSTERKRTRERTTSSTKETATVKRFSSPPEGSRSRRKDTSWFISVEILDATRLPLCASQEHGYSKDTVPRGFPTQYPQSAEGLSSDRVHPRPSIDHRPGEGSQVGPQRGRNDEAFSVGDCAGTRKKDERTAPFDSG